VDTRANRTQQEELTQAKRSLEAEKERMREVQSNASKWEEENSKLKNDLNNLTKELENTNRRNAEEEKRQQKIRAQAQKTTKEAYKFVKEISELSRKNEELETELKHKEQELMAVADDIISLRQELENKSALLDTTAHAKEELDEEVNSLRERVTEFTVREDEREEEHEVFMQDITKRVRSLKEDAAAKASELEMVNKELREAKATIEQMEEDKQASAGERRLAELQAEITQLHDEKSESLEQYMEMQRENKKCKQQLLSMEAEEKKVLKRLHVQYKARENELRAGFFEKQDEMAEAERRNAEMSNRTAELQDTVMELEQHITQLENGTFGLSEAMDRVKELKRDVEVGNNKISIRTKELNEALRKIEDLHEEVGCR
jgi:chromosome segregation ATPase